MLELVLPILRADFRLCSSYVYRPEPPLDVPIVAFAGTHDRDAGADKMREWEQQTSADFAMRVIDGDHFFVTRRRETLLAELSRDLLK
jgi:surfactin synthase thioesterase subunit